MSLSFSSGNGLHLTYRPSQFHDFAEKLSHLKDLTSLKMPLQLGYPRMFDACMTILSNVNLRLETVEFGEPSGQYVLIRDGAGKFEKACAVEGMWSLALYSLYFSPTLIARYDSPMRREARCH